MKPPLVVALDGPAGAGKSAVAKGVAEGLGWAHLDSGALFRALAALALQAGVDLDDEPALAALFARAGLEPDGRGGVTARGRPLAATIRGGRVSGATPQVARHPAVREAVALCQRRFAEQAGWVVAEGRDMGTVVFPEAALKVFLDADPAERARRRLAQEAPAAADDPAALEAVRGEIAARDAADRGRRHAPLAPAPGAWILDTTGMSLDEVVAAVLHRVRSGIPVVPEGDSRA